MFPDNEKMKTMYYQQQVERKCLKAKKKLELEKEEEEKANAAAKKAKQEEEELCRLLSPEKVKELQEMVRILLYND
jgi:hypothetical protein